MDLEQEAKTWMREKHMYGITGTAYQIDERGFNILNSSGSSVAKGDYYCNYKASAEL